MLKNVAIALSGMVAGVLTATLLVPRVLADTPRAAGAVRWQQFCEPASSIAEASSISGARGVEGWELVGFFGGALCFKRPAPAAGPPSPASPASPGPPTPGPQPTSWPGY